MPICNFSFLSAFASSPRRSLAGPPHRTWPGTAQFPSGSAVELPWANRPGVWPFRVPLLLQGLNWHLLDRGGMLQLSTSTVGDLSVEVKDIDYTKLCWSISHCSKAHQTMILKRQQHFEIVYSVRSTENTRRGFRRSRVRGGPSHTTCFCFSSFLLILHYPHWP
jgi:hypothetical protein